MSLQQTPDTEMNTIEPGLMDQFMEYDLFQTNGYGQYYSCLDPQKVNISILDNKDHSNLGTEKILKGINQYGTISPNGPIIDTPSKIKINLKAHQKRTLYEMNMREAGNYRFTDGLNVNFLCDNVGSGKSLCVLSLIANNKLSKLSPQVYYSDATKSVGSSNSSYYSYANHNNNNYNLGSHYYIHNGLDVASDCIELDSNVIIIPHNVYNQWENYITSQTSLSYIGIGSKRHYKNIGTNKNEIIQKCKDNDIILIKSTMFKGFRSYLDSTFDVEPHIDNDSYSMSTTSSEGVKPSDHLSKLADDFKTTSASMYYNINKILQSKSIEEPNTACELNNMFNNLEKLKDTISKVKNDINYDNWDKDNANKRCPVSRLNILKGYCFQRVFVDEVDSIRIPAFPYCYGKQIWFITSSINNITYPKGKRIWDYDTQCYKTISSGISGTGFLKEIITNIFRKNQWSIKAGDHRAFFNIVRNNIKYVEFSMKIPEPIIEYVQCLTPAHLLAISSAINSDALKALNAGDFDHAVELLGCNQSSEEDLVNQVTAKLVKQFEDMDSKVKSKQTKLNELESNLQETEETLALSIDILPNDMIEELKEEKKSLKSLISSTKSSIENFTYQKSVLEEKINGIKNRMTDVDNKECPVCRMGVEGPCITPCCKNVFCLECLTMAITTSAKSECPICRSHIDLNKVNIIIKDQDKKEEVKDENQLPTKIEKLLDIVKDKSKRFMVFSEFDGGLSKIESEFCKNEIRYSGIKGTSNTISKTIEQFKNKEFNVLLLNAKYFGAGLNLQFTDEIVIYHRMSKDLEKQVIGRAQRLGRVEPLRINYLCYENEY